MNSEINQKIIDYLIKYKPQMIAIFGSYARKEQKKGSDIDILVSFKQDLTLIDLSRIKNELSEQLKIKVDLITQKALHPKLKAYIEKDLKIIYE